MSSPRDSASEVASASLDLTQRLQKHFATLIALVHQFHQQPPTPAATFAFEKKLPICCVRPGVM